MIFAKKDDIRDFGSNKISSSQGHRSILQMFVLSKNAYLDNGDMYRVSKMKLCQSLGTFLMATFLWLFAICKTFYLDTTDLQSLMCIFYSLKRCTLGSAGL